MPIKGPGEDDFDRASERAERAEPPPERRPQRQSPGRLPPPAAPAKPKKGTKVGGMVPLERMVKSGRLPGLQKGRKRSDIAKRFRSVIGNGPKTDDSSGDDFGDSKSIYDDED
jgi:hypothetical protein